MKGKKGPDTDVMVSTPLSLINPQLTLLIEYAPRKPEDWLHTSPWRVLSVRPENLTG